MSYKTCMAQRREIEPARVEFRMSPKLKMEVEEAADLLGTTFTAFATQALLERAREVKREYVRTRLNDAERDVFLKMLEKPPKPNAAFKKLMRTRVIL